MFVDVFSHKIYYEAYGAEHRNTLLYLHGGPGASCLDFVNQAKALGEKIRVILFDQFGVLRSDAIGEDEDYSMEYQVEMLEEMRKSFGIEQWNILGHSYGGMLAILYAYRHPESIQKVILECPSLWFEDSAKSVAEYVSGHIASLGNPEASKLCEKLKAPDYPGGQETPNDLMTLLNYVEDPKLGNYLHGISFEEYWQSMDASGIHDEMWAKGERHLKKLLETGPAQEDAPGKRVTMLDNFLPLAQEIALPILLLNGKYDPACTKDQTDYLLSRGRNVTRVVFENSGHFPRIEEPEKYTRAVLSFLEA